jgi:protein involved in polysaccharide export with SLBB domain
MMRRLAGTFGWAGLVLCLGLAGCSTPDDFSYSEPEATESGTEPAAATVASRMASPDTLRPGDRIEIGFSGNSTAPVYPHREQIRENGEIEPPLLGTNVMAAGKTIGQLQNELHDLYVPAFFKTLTVTVRLEDRYFFVGGQVRMPGQKLYLSEMTVTKAVQSAGDFTDFANRRKVEIVRKDGSREVVDFKKALRDSKADVPIYPGDMIHVNRRW